MFVNFFVKKASFCTTPPLIKIDYNFLLIFSQFKPFLSSFYETDEALKNFHI